MSLIGHYAIPLEKADIVMEGDACTVIAWGAMVHVAEQGIKNSGINAELNRPSNITSMG
ncbi:MAG: hypothetical protein CM15mP71_4890 [Candidatus Poseidoniales archaeon]|nr:MAG: hypothetical protein CM15mP71_4890 [Candidatus Poseidoniales archaeon]